MVGTPPPFVTSPPPVRSPPQPVAATLVLATSTLTVEFDDDIEDRLHWNAGNWWYQATPTARFHAASVTRPTPTTIQVVLQGSPLPTPGSVGTNYDPPPFNLRGLTGSVTPAFYGFPTAVV